MSGAPVWQALDQAELDRAYDQSQWAANMAEVMARYVSGSERTRQRLGPPQPHLHRRPPSPTFLQ